MSDAIAGIPERQNDLSVVACDAGDRRPSMIDPHTMPVTETSADPVLLHPDLEKARPAIPVRRTLHMVRD